MRGEREEEWVAVMSCPFLRRFTAYMNKKKEVGGSDRKQIENYPMSV